MKHYDVSELKSLIQKETDLINELESTHVEPEYHKRADGTPYYQYPTGNYAVHLTKIKDAYWRRRNWRDALER